MHDIETHNGRLKPDIAEVSGRKALSLQGDARFFGVWRVLYYYLDNADEPSFRRWIKAVQATAARDHDAELAQLTGFMDLAFLNHSREYAAFTPAQWRLYLDRSGRNLHLVAELEKIQSESHSENWAAATQRITHLLTELEGLGVIGLPLQEAVHIAASDALSSIGDPNSAIDHMVEAVAIDRKIGAFTPDAEHVYDLTNVAIGAGLLTDAENLLALHSRLIKTSGGPNALFYNRFLCASVAYARRQYDRVLACYHDIDAKIDQPDSKQLIWALRHRFVARVRLQHLAEAEADLARLRQAKVRLSDTPRFNLYAKSLIERAEGKGLQAYDDFSDWHFQQFADLNQWHRRVLANISGALMAEIQVKRDESARLAQDVALNQRLKQAWAALAVMFAILCVCGVAWALHLRNLSRRLKAAQQKADSANAAKSSFLAILSHELRTPLNGILGMAQTLRQEPLSATQTDEVNVIIDSGSTMLTLLNDILDLSKIEAGKLEIVAAPADLRDVCSRATRLYQSLAKDKGLDLTLEIAGDVPAVLTFDALRVRQCLANLISNALKFTQTGGVKITVCGQFNRDPVQVSICVSDTGVGMNANTLAKLFSAYTQAHADTAHTYGGTGLGLNITRRLAEAMGGSVEVESAEGQGSTFTLRFLAATANTALSAPEDSLRLADANPSGLELAPLSGLRVLVADDHPANRKVVQLMLAPFGCRVVEAIDGQAALDLLAAEAVDLVLMDVNMPVLDGLAATRRIRSDPALAALPVIALTADDSPEQIQKTLSAGMDAQVAKPIDAGALLSALCSVLQRRAGQTETAGTQGSVRL